MKGYLLGLDSGLGFKVAPKPSISFLVFCLLFFLGGVCTCSERPAEAVAATVWRAVFSVTLCHSSRARGLLAPRQNVKSLTSRMNIQELSPHEFRTALSTKEAQSSGLRLPWVTGLPLSRWDPRWLCCRDERVFDSKCRRRTLTRASRSWTTKGFWLTSPPVVTSV